MPLLSYPSQPTYVEGACIHELFELQAKRTPNAPAVIFKDESLTYAELNCRANQVAWNLIKLGVGPDVTVGIFAERSIAVIIGLLGVLKAGGTCFPLDPEYPKERLAFMLRDGEVRFLLVDGQFIERLPKHQAEIIRLDAANELTDAPKKDPPSHASSENVAYVIYTSGSTGKPKGVEVIHRGIVRLLFGVDYVNLDQTKVVLQLSAITFDGSIFDIWGALLHGARCVLYPGRVPVIHELSDLLRMHNVTTAFLTTSFFNTIVDEEPNALASLEQLLVGGEALSVQHIRRAWAHLAGVEIINVYGPTEATVFACSYRIPKEPHATANSIPIGRPIGSTEAYILDQNLLPVPVGIAGDLYLGGPGIARGYRNRPELTVQKFIPDPFSKEPNARLYKTGDLARFLADGNIDFLGRTDDQVKIRGFRIELGEIEASLRRHSGVRDAIVLPYTDSRGDKRLSAFVVRKAGLELSVDKLREFLRQRLPEFMMASRCCILDRWPLTPGGKVDRQALAIMGTAAGKISSETIPPRSTVENVLVEMWQELLDVRPIGIRDSFFDLGGDSLQAVQLLAQIEEVFDKRLPVGTLLGAATIEQLAPLLHKPERLDRLTYNAPLQPSGENPIFFCIGPAWLFRPLSIELGPDQPFYSIDFKSEYAEELTRASQMEELAHQLVLELRERQPEGPYYLGGFCVHGVFAYEVASQLTAQGQSVRLLALFETENPYPSARTRIRNGLRRAIMLFHYRVNKVCRLGISGIPLYIRRDLKATLTRRLRRISRHFPLPKRKPAPSELEEILVLAASSYKPRPLGCPTVIFGCKEWPIAAAGDPYFGWRESLIGRCETYEVPGNHIGILDESNIQVLADQLRACLRSVKQPERSTSTVTVDVVNAFDVNCSPK